ncbi:xanthine dehydrogenase family protein molybdopterin-binding subunit [Maribacter sp. X9]|uniref:xanthine dehydrogenase family protein molybdopterin-binding subunit n=1 Tax=Maribacter sp. X9 TaxID=3402159 RepID=UPI003AF39601
MELNTQYIGKSTDRVDGREKVTGRAMYAGEVRPENLLHGYVVCSSIAKGTIREMDYKKALEVPGVLEVFTHFNIPKNLKINSDYTDPLSPPGNPFRPLYNDAILYNGQPIALVVAVDFETARYAANLIKVSYSAEEAIINIQDNIKSATHDDVQDPPHDRGDAGSAFNAAEIKIDVQYSQPRHFHNPMEPHVTVASWNDAEESFTIYDKIQGVNSSQEYICGIFSLKPEQVRVLSPFLGGGFGSGLRPQYQLFLAAMASKVLGSPVKVELTRSQMFSFGHRPSCIQHLKMSCNSNGKLRSIFHRAYGETSVFEKFSEDVVSWSGLMYYCENVSLDYQLVPVDMYTACDMRGPGGTTGMFALECAIDELAMKANIDPLEFRLLNYADKDQNEEKPFSSKELKACYQSAADTFGWKKGVINPRSNKKGHQLVGYGMATGVWEAMQKKSAAKAVLNSKGHLTVSSSTADIGTGTYTVMTQIASETMGVAMNETSFELGDTTLVKAPIEGGSYTVSSVGSAVKAVCMALRNKLWNLATSLHAESFKGVDISKAIFENGFIKLKNGSSFSYESLLKGSNTPQLEATLSLEPEDERDEYSCFAHSCVMVEVNVDEDLGMISVPRVVTAVAGGKIINPKTAESQLLGAITWGIGMALEEEGMVDSRNGRIMNANLAEYHVAVQADVQNIDIIFVEEEDDIVNPLGAKGLGEIGLVGVASAIANAIYQATGKRVRDLPITLDKLL